MRPEVLGRVAERDVRSELALETKVERSWDVVPSTPGTTATRLLLLGLDAPVVRVIVELRWKVLGEGSCRTHAQVVAPQVVSATYAARPPLISHLSAHVHLNRMLQKLAKVWQNSLQNLAQTCSVINIFYWRYVALVVVLWCPATVVVVVGVCNRSQMRTIKCTCLIFGVSIDLEPD